MNIYEKALNDLISFVNKHSSYGYVYGALFVLQELIDKQEKYKWHDLRKDPNDMPKIECEKYLVDTGDSYHSYSVARIIDGKFAIYDSEWDDFRELNVKRWKYIEEFEEE